MPSNSTTRLAYAAWVAVCLLWGTTYLAIRIALEQEHDNVHRAALRLGLTDRAVQLRRANNRQLT